MSDVTCILKAVERGDGEAAGKLLPLVYDELRKLAAQRMAHESPGQTLQPTALVHEAWLRLGGDKDAKWGDRAHFFAAAAEAMRRILIENARRKAALRHGGGQKPVPIDEIEIADVPRDDDLLSIDSALEKLSGIDKQKAELVKLRYFVGLTIEEAADVLGIAPRTVKLWWSYARAWLHEEIKTGQNR
jgi:RNA polymerase sigma factor (TIGR02999 family)